jgi:hypothetical protein
MFRLCGSMEDMFRRGSCTSKYGLATVQHCTSISPYSLTGQRRHLLHASTTTFLFVSRCLWLMLRLGLDARAHSAGVHTCHAPDCMPVLLTWQPTPPSHHSCIQVFITLGWLCMVMGLVQDICCHFVLKHLALLRAFENTSALKVII